MAREERLFDALKDSDGNDPVVVYLKKEKAVKRLPSNWSILAEGRLVETLQEMLGESNVKVVEKSIEKMV